MPSLYLSPSTQEGNPYITGGSEEYYMNLLADELVPYLGANAIAYTRNTPDMTAVSSVAQANAGCYDLYSHPSLQRRRPFQQRPSAGRAGFLLPHQRQRPAGSRAVRARI